MGEAGVIRTSAPVNVVIHTPETEEGRQELEGRIAGVHAEFVAGRVMELNCPAAQKRALLKSVMEAGNKMKSHGES